jgi:hypothetical protein
MDRVAVRNCYHHPLRWPAENISHRCGRYGNWYDGLAFDGLAFARAELPVAYQLAMKFYRNVEQVSTAVADDGLAI